MITLHHLNNSRSQRILWMLEDLGLPYEIKPYQRNPVTELAPESLKKVHPLGKAPVITDGDLNLAESGLIIEYLAETYGRDKLWPSDPKTLWQCKYWLHYAEGSLMPLLVMRLIFDKINSSPMPFFIKPVAKGISDQVNKAYLGPNLRTHMEYIEKHLAANDWFAGKNFSAADIQMSFPLEAAESRRALVGEYPNIRAWVQKIHAMPAYQRALKAGGPYDYA